MENNEFETSDHIGTRNSLFTCIQFFVHDTQFLGATLNRSDEEGELCEKAALRIVYFEFFWLEKLKLYLESFFHHGGQKRWAKKGVDAGLLPLFETLSLDEHQNTRQRKSSQRRPK